MWEIDLGRRQLRLQGTPVTVGPRAFEIIALLAQAAGELVTKDQIVQRVWNGAAVGENALHVHIHALRRALGTDRVLLKSASGQGYRLTGNWAQKSIPVETGRSLSQPSQGRSEAPSSNLPLNVNELVGRSDAVRRVRELLSAGSAVTLTGTGGIGKSALAIESARGFGAGQGVWLTELASIADATLVPSTVAGVLTLTIAGEVRPESIARAVADRSILLVLDNCEHLIDATATLVETLTRMCPRVKILSTSREPLRVEGETVFRVPALDVPAPAQRLPSDILGCSAVALFVARAAALDIGFAPLEEELVAIGEICRQLDGIPLAIEFAAARTAAIGTRQVALGLRDRFTLLTSGRRTAIPKHRTLRATLDWSYELLSEEEQRLLRHLAIFPATFSLEAVQAVGGDRQSDQATIDDLTSLASKSLCERVDGPTTRWRLLQTIRAYALEKLVERDEHSDAARRHAVYFRNLVQPLAASAAAFLRPEDVERCSWELDNVRAALDWAFAPEGDKDLGASLTVAFAPIWQSKSLLGECRDRVNRMLSSLPPARNSVEAGEWRMWIAYSHASAMTLRPIETSRAAIAKATELVRDHENPDVQIGLLHVQWSVEFTSGAHSAALAAARRLVDVTSRQGDAMKLAGERILGASLLFSGELNEAQELLQGVVDNYVPPPDGHHSTLFRRDPQVLARVRLARALALRGYLDRALDEARSSLDAAQRSGTGITVCWAAHDSVCPIALLRGDLEIAEEAAAAMSDWAARLDAALWTAMSRCWKGALAIERGQFEHGIELLAPTLQNCEQTGWQMGYAMFLGYLAEGLAGSGRIGEASARLERAIAFAERSGERSCLPELVRLKAELVLQKRGERHLVEADGLFRSAIKTARGQGALSLELRAALGLARCLAGQGQSGVARQLVSPVYRRFSEGFSSEILRETRELMAKLAQQPNRGPRMT